MRRGQGGPLLQCSCILFVSFIWEKMRFNCFWSWVRVTPTLVIELLIFFRHRVSSSLDSRAHCTQLAGGCKYLREGGRCTFKPQPFQQVYDRCLLFFKYVKHTFHTACRSALWLAWGSPLRCRPEYAGRRHTCWLGWEEWGLHRYSTGWGGEGNTGKTQCTK